MAKIEHRHWGPRPELAALLLLSPKSFPTMNLLSGAGTAGGFNTVQAGVLRGRGRRMHDRGCISSLISSFYQGFALGLGPL